MHNPKLQRKTNVQQTFDGSSWGQLAGDLAVVQHPEGLEHARPNTTWKTRGSWRRLYNMQTSVSFGRSASSQADREVVHVNNLFQSHA